MNELFQITEEMLNLLSLKATTKSEDIFHAFEHCLRKNNLDLDIFSGISTDSVPATIRKEKEAIKLLIDKIESNLKNHNCYKTDYHF